MTAPGNPPPTGPQRVHEPLFVDVGFQARALLPLLIFAGLYALLLLIVLFLPLSRSVAADPDLAQRYILQAHMMEIHLRLWPLLVVAGLFAAYISFYRSLRAVRPVYRLHYTLQAIVAGDHRPLAIGPKEEFRFLEEDVAQLNQKMKLIATRNRDILLNVNAHIRKLADRVAADEIIARAELEEVIAAICAQLDKAPELGLPGRPGGNRARP